MGLGQALLWERRLENVLMIEDEGMDFLIHGVKRTIPLLVH